MYSSKTFYGGTFLDRKDMEESNINNIIELEYYKTEKSNKLLKNELKLYGIEILKKEYRNEDINIETNSIDCITNDENETYHILEVLKKNKVTPVCLQEIVKELLRGV